MKNYFVIISIMIIFLIPLNASALSEEMLQEWLLSCCELVWIEDKNQPHAYGYNLLRNSNGELVGVIHVTASQYLDNPLFGAFLNEQPVIENVTIEGTQFAILVLQAEVNNHPAFCFDQKGMGQGDVNGKCFFYTFETNLDATFTANNLMHRVTAFNGLHHGFLSEAGDRISVNWTALIPTN